MSQEVIAPSLVLWCVREQLLFLNHIPFTLTYLPLFKITLLVGLFACLV